MLQQSSISSNPSSPPCISKCGSISFHSYTINDMLTFEPLRKVDVYGRIISIGEPYFEMNKFGRTEVLMVCISDETNSIWVKLQKRLLDSYGQIFIGDEIVLRNLVVQEEEEVISLVDDIWSSLLQPESIDIQYFTLS